MHIPDNYLSPSTCAFFGTIMIPIWRKASRKIKKEITRQKMPLLGVCSAFSFLIMMFNVPLPGGTTAHAVGAALIGVLLGPWAAVISVTIALSIQALLFGDGGILSLGANTFNMAFVMPFVAHYVYRFIKGNSNNDKRDYMAAFAAGYIALNASVLCAALEFGIQPLIFKDASGLPLYCPYSFKVSLPAMLLPHLFFIGFIEAVVTAGVLAYVKRISPDIVKVNRSVEFKPLNLLILALVALSPLGLIATGTAWGEWSTEEIKDIVGFVPSGMGKGFEFKTILPDYFVAGIPEKLGYVFSAAIGVAAIYLFFKLISKPQKKTNLN